MQTEDPEIECPYNPNHWILKSGMQSHIVKCKENHPLAVKMVCPFNVIHHVDEPLYQHHVSTCPDRAGIEGYKYQQANIIHGDIDCGTNHQTELPLPEENDRLEPLPIIRKLQGATKSQRKAFRLAERQHMQREMEGEPPSSSSNGSPDYQVVKGNDLAPPRLPRMQSEHLTLLNQRLGLGRGRHRASEENHNIGSAPNLEFAQGMSVTLPIAVGRGKSIMK